MRAEPWSRARRAAAPAAAWLALLAPAAPAQTVARQVDPAHTGVTAAPIAPPLTERWRRTFDPSVPIDHTVRYPLVADGRVFVTVQIGSDAPVVHALDAATGQTHWSRTLTRWPRGAGYGAGKLIVSTDSTLYALDAGSGQVAWTWPAGSGPAIAGSAVISDGAVYVPTNAGVTALRTHDGAHLWTSADLGMEDGLAVAGDRIYVNAVTAAVALQRSDGGIAWRWQPPTYTEFAFGEPAVRDGRVYLPGTPQGAVLDAASGALLRRPWIHGAVAVDGERAYILDGEPGEEGEVLHVRGAADGATRWEFGAEEGITTFPLVSGESVYAMGIRGSLYALDRATGRLTWCTDTRTINYSRSQVSLASGDGLLVLAIGGEVVALEPGGAPGCDYYGVSIPGYHGTGGDTRAGMAAAPAGFEENRGQFPASVRYAARDVDHALLVGREGATLALGRRGGILGGETRIELGVRGGDAADAVRGVDRLPGVVNDYRGPDPARWRTGVPLYRGVRLQDLAPGVDLVLRRGRADRFAYDVVLRPGADARGLALEFRGGGRPRLDGRGGLLIGTPAGVLRQPPPVAFQEVGGRRVRVPARFRLRSDGSVGFALGRVDRRRALVIDPELEWGSFLGGGVDDGASTVATDAAGYVYVAGWTRSRDFAGTGALDTWDERNAICEEKPCGDAVVAKYRPDGGLVHVTYLSGRREDRAEAVAADASGNAYVTGFTMSPNFPVRNALQGDWRCGVYYGDAFVAKLAPDGSRLDYSTYLGGCWGFLGDAGRDIAVDAQGRAVVAGHTDSQEFPTTAGASDRRCAPADGFCDDAFVARLSADGRTLEWSTLFGGDGSQEYAYELELDALGRPVIAGTAYGFTTTDFPATPGSYDEEIDPAFSEVFAARLAADGSRLEWATAFGGRDWDDGLGLALDAQGDVHIAGRTESSDFPTTPGAHDRVCNVVYEQWSCTNHADAFALELSADGARLLASTYVGGGGDDDARAVDLDADGRAYLTGATASSPPGFPLADAFQPELRNDADFCASRSDCSDAYVLRLSADKSQVGYSSYLGGRSYEAGEGVALAGGDAWVSGFTHSTDLPTTPGAAQASAPGGDCSFLRDALEFRPCTDAFLARIGPQPSATPAVPPGSPPPSAPEPQPSPSGPTAGTGAPSVGDHDTAVQERRLLARRTKRGVRGHVAGAPLGCVARVPVLLERHVRGRWRRVASARTDARGAFSFALRRRGGRYRVRLPTVTRTLGDLRSLRCAPASARVAARATARSA